MKYIRYPEEIKTALGHPIFVDDPDTKVQREVLLAAKAKGKESYDRPIVEADFKILLSWFINNLPFDRDDKGKPTHPLTISDTGHGYDIIKAVANSFGQVYIPIEKAPYEWLIEVVDREGPIALGMTVAVLKECLENLLTEDEIKALTQSNGAIKQPLPLAA